MVHVYEAHPRNDPKAKTCFFVRALVRKMDRIGGDGATRASEENMDVFPGPERAFVEALNALEGPMGSLEGGSGANHIFLNALPRTEIAPSYVEQQCRQLYRRYRRRLKMLRVMNVELRVRITSPSTVG